MGQESGREGAGRARGAPRFDTEANLRALGEVQRMGLEAANDIVGRLVNLGRSSGPLFGAETSQGAQGADLSRMFEMWAEPFRAMLGAFGAAPAQGTRAGSDGAGVTAEPLTMKPVAAGGVSTGELWLHNRSGLDVADVRLHCGDLQHHAGSVIPSECVEFDPPKLGELPDLTSRGVRVSISVAAHTQAGIYRTTVLASNLESVWLALELTVTPT